MRSEGQNEVAPSVQLVRGGKIMSNSMIGANKTEELDQIEELDRQLDGLLAERQPETPLPRSRATPGPRAANQDEDVKRENVRVMVRCRPLNCASDPINSRRRVESINNIGSSSSSSSRKESAQSKGPTDQVVRLDEDTSSVELMDRRFQFDAAFGPHSDNQRVYLSSARQLVEWAFAGYNCTLFLYGQTGTGKTYTHSSLTSMAFVHLFGLIGDSSTRSNFLIRASYYELYNEEIRDLLVANSKALELRESKVRGVYVKDLSCFLVNSLADLEKLKRIGDRKRTTAATRMNKQSSRSHSIFSITIEALDGRQQEPPAGKRAARAASASQAPAVRVGRLNLIDLAGSERQAKSGSQDGQLKEASRINLSLTCLSLVIRALTDEASSHVPYRNSKLTRLLSSSLGGNSKTQLIACISPAASDLAETLNTLRFASRAKKIKNKAKLNEDPKDALLRKYRRQIEELRDKLRLKQLEQEAARGSTGEGQTDQAPSLELPNEEQPPMDQEHDELVKQLQLLKGKIMVGGENLLEKVEMHERLLDACRKELEERRMNELKLKEMIERKREIIDKMNQSKGSLEGQKLELDGKLKRVVELYKKIEDEKKDLVSEHQQLKESLLQSIRATSKEIKYADCIIEDFIPREYLDMINTYAQYDDESDEWQIKYIALSGNNIAQTKRITQLDGGQDDEEPAAGPNQVKGKLNHRLDPYIRLKDLNG